MTLDPPITPDEEDIIRRVRTLQAKQAELAKAEADNAVTAAKVIVERANAENLRKSFIEEMRKRGVSDPDELARPQR